MNIICPEGSCHVVNETSASECIRCGTPLQSYIRLLNHSAYLFNQGLARARAGAFEEARDLFAAVVYWCPKDLEARNALAMACLALHDLLEARKQWEYVLEIAPADTLARHGLNQLASQVQPGELSAPVSKSAHPPHIYKYLVQKKKKKS